MSKKKVTEDVVKKKKMSRKTIVAIGTIMVGIIMTFSTLLCGLYNARITVRDRLQTATMHGRIEYENNAKKGELYLESTAKCFRNIIGFAAYCYETNGHTLTVGEQLNNDIGDYMTLYYFNGRLNDDKKVFEGRVTNEFRTNEKILEKLSGEEIYELLTDGYYHNDGVIYAAEKIANGSYVVGMAGVEEIMTKQRMLEEYSTKDTEVVIRFNCENGDIEDANNETLVGMNFNGIFKEGNSNNINRGTLEFCRLIDGHSVYLYIDEEKDGVAFCAMLGVRDILFDMLVSVGILLSLGWLFLILILVYVEHFIKKNEDADIVDREFVKLYKNNYMDRKLVSHIVGLAILAVILVAAGMVYILTLVNYSNQNVTANDNLKAASYFIELNDSNEQIMNEDFLDMNGMLVDCISSYYLRYPRQLSGENIYNLNKHLPFVSSISIFDDKGTEICDSGTEYRAKVYDVSVGYTLNKDEKAPEHVCYDVLNGIEAYVAYREDKGAKLYYVAGRRQDKDGIIRLTVDPSVIDEFASLTKPERVLSEAYFGTANKALIRSSATGKLIWIKANESEPVELNNNLPAAVTKNGYSGNVRIDGVRYYINTAVLDEKGYTIMSALRTSELSGIKNIYMLITVVMAFILQNLVIVGATSYKFDEEPLNGYRLRDFHETPTEQIMDTYFRKAVRRMFIITCLVIALILGGETFYNDDSLLGYLMGNTWPKGINLFSFTKIIMLVALAIVGGGILKKLVILFTNNMGPRGVTIGRMIGSIIKFVILVVVICITIIDLGVNVGTMITGVGIFGAVISFCAQQTVNDFLSGFFIVFEGVFNIGDWITVDDFRGQVIDIGIRTTKIGKGGNIKIINNSELKKVLVMAPNGKGALCYVDIAYKEDIDKVIELIKHNKQRYVEEIPYILEGPYIDGVTSLGYSGVTLAIWALAEQENVNALEREIFRVTKDMFDENGIEIPFNQVTIHTAD